mmetsp:Transcript_46019/g.51464  ORF Transcript_46019/g.51464 Transcript_46019/m.51464 type:complete len:186 (+) Transcript_46019:122-679(+)|eukprot:CAMPEP_0170836804 /NCGR_PEP_ID=MMETSP0734-20130129/2385_1 /TAXON_ID=186038 /ORGANISM="Fragilariopsis kerguelensis, Strain L26-C5" /LENGTH=185 /DNA_ID=CAMNT_0011203861 /DNA_START=119 /DNA_END=676 /DNA_ORIENTATION=+
MAIYAAIKDDENRGHISDDMIHNQVKKDPTLFETLRSNKAVVAAVVGTVAVLGVAGQAVATYPNTVSVVVESPAAALSFDYNFDTVGILPKCSRSPKCAHLTGDCCPAPSGVYLACCKRYHPLPGRYWCSADYGSDSVCCGAKDTPIDGQGHVVNCPSDKPKCKEYGPQYNTGGPRGPYGHCEKA